MIYTPATPSQKQMSNEFLFCDLSQILDDPHSFTDRRYYTNSLPKYELPGFDPKWDLKRLMCLRREADRGTHVVLWSNRPDYADMRKEIEKIAQAADVEWYRIVLRPVMALGHEANYKLSVVRSLVPDARDKVLFLDREETKQLLESRGQPTGAGRRKP